MRLQNVLVVHKIGFTEKEKIAYNNVISVLKNNHILHRSISLLEVHPDMIHERDLIIVVGGDGTFLKTAHAVTDIPFLCINADPQKTEGFFSTTTAENAEKKLMQIRAGKIKPTALWRLQAYIDNKPVEPCLNEYYVGEQKPYHVSKYIFNSGKKQEMQKSSGVIISTAAGSTAWCRSAGGKVMQRRKKQFQFVVRDPYIGRLAKTKLKKGIVEKNARFTITPLSENMILVADAVGREYVLSKNSCVHIQQSEKPVYVFY
jgi:NAD+ kinase